MKLTRRRRDGFCFSMWWDWPIIRRKHVYELLRHHRPVWEHEEWLRVCLVIESLPAFEKSNHFGNDYVDLRDLAGKIRKKNRTDRQIFKAWEQARTEEEKRQAVIEIERERIRQWQRLMEAKALLRELRRLLRGRGRARSQDAA